MKVILQAGAVEMESGQLVTGSTYTTHNVIQVLGSGGTGQREKKIVNIKKSKS